MKTTFIRSCILAFIVSFLIVPQSKASWAYSFVVWDGYVYIVSDESVENIDKEIGHVTKHSDKEGSYWGNFSNAFPKGTKYYSITDTSTNDAIAVQTTEGIYVKATREGKYMSEYPLTAIIAFTIIMLVFILGIIIFRPVKKGINK
ncbi:hypothetical protein KHA96_07105 [Bacillus sp. FJAT-49711]|uniref:hypothetical protein n=1 Tax=Bacillus sp. FJAT-49711 TaxID=2833585 RepID=UPI001BC91916|nr:hypothetical protein [Bacillus sp. FJAT-49711]MBS4218091.1 hypothetical protein [Bacillus sp. FJAT-49711]